MVKRWVSKMIFQIQKEYIYLAIAIFLFYFGGFCFYPNKYYLFLLLILVLFYANKPYKVKFVENQFIEIYRMLGKKKIKFQEIKKIIRGTHKDAIVLDGSVIYIGHLIDRVNVLTDLIEKSIHPIQPAKSSSMETAEITKLKEPSSFDLINIAIRVTIAAVILSAIGVLFFTKFIKSV